MKCNRINIGEEIRKIVKERSMSNASFARLIGIQRQNVEKQVFQKTSIDTDLLILISETLDYNFFQLFKDTGSTECNQRELQEVKLSISLEIGEEKKDQIFHFLFGKK